jgi:membrane dipeptidase
LKKLILFIVIGLLTWECSPGQESIEGKAKRIHEKVLTVDSHTDSPWYLLQGGFNMAERHDFEKTGSRLDFPRMKEGGLDAVFFAAFVKSSTQSTPSMQTLLN